MAQNQQEVRQKVVEYSGGNPGGIIAMVKMATQQKYRSNERVKLSPLYIDFRLAASN